jgi:hypothetical protein
MEPAPEPDKRSYFQPLLVNGFLLAVLSLPIMYRLSSSDCGSLNGLAFFMLATLALPLVNFCCLVGTLSVRRRHLGLPYALLTLVWTGLVWWFLVSALGAFHKIGG